MPTATASPATTRPARTSGPVVRRLGPVGYGRAWALQRELVAARAADEIADTLLLLSHPPVVTVGRGGSPTHLLATRAELAACGVELVETDRGGDVTFHGPGQVVGYPIVDLTARGRDLHRYMRDVEQVVILALAEFGLDAGRVPGLTGVWVGDAKVAAIGIRVSRWIAHHGFALNVDVDLSFFGLIVPCGIADRRVTSMTELLGRAADPGDVEDALERAFARVFGGGAAA